MERESPLNEEEASQNIGKTPLSMGSGSRAIVQQLRRAYLSISRCGDAMFSPYRLTTDQYALMRAVQRNPGVRQSDLREVIFAEPNTVTAMVTLLEKRGILRRKLSATDGRVRLLFLTPHGNAVMNRLSEDWDPMRTILRDCFAGEDGRRALEILDRVYQEMKRERENLLRKAGAFGHVEPDQEEVQPENPPADTTGSAAKSRTHTSRRNRDKHHPENPDDDEPISFAS
jgi:MarR family transcriptional regulator, temperature-dependent positive regulator of motility